MALCRSYHSFGMGLAIIPFALSIAFCWKSWPHCIRYSSSLYSRLSFGNCACTSNMDVIQLVVFPMSSPKLLMLARIASSSVTTIFLAFRCTHTSDGISFSRPTNTSLSVSIQNGTELAKKLGIKVTLPKWGLSHSDYYFTKDKNVIAKGLNSIKYMSAKLADEMSALYSNTYDHFVDLLAALDAYTSIDTRQLDILIKLDFFSDFGNQRELLRITEFFNGMFKQGDAKQLKKSDIDGTQLEPIVKKYAVGVTKSGGEAKSYTLLDVWSILREVEDLIKASGMPDLSDIIKVQNFKDIMGYVGYTSGREEDRRKLYVTGTKPLMRKKDGRQFGYSIYTKSIGTGKEARFTIFNERYNRDPIYEGNIVYCKKFARDGAYFRLLDYEKVV